jgi:hypothetical protein
MFDRFAEHIEELWSRGSDIRTSPAHAQEVGPAGFPLPRSSGRAPQ